jgi:hypothetical protein
MVDHGSAQQCPHNDCGPYHFDGSDGGEGGWIISNGSGMLVSGGGWIDPDDPIYVGTPLDANETPFAPQKGKKKPRRRQTKIEPEGGLVGIPLPIRIEHFDQTEADQIRSALEKLFTDKCAEAYRAAGLREPLEFGRVRLGQCFDSAILKVIFDEVKLVGQAENRRMQVTRTSSYWRLEPGAVRIQSLLLHRQCRADRIC